MKRFLTPALTPVPVVGGLLRLTEEEAEEGEEEADGDAEAGEEDSSTSDSATKRWKIGRRGCRNLHSLCAKREYVPTVPAAALSSPPSAFPSFTPPPIPPPRSARRTPSTKNGSCVINSRGSPWER